MVDADFHVCVLFLLFFVEVIAWASNQTVFILHSQTEQKKNFDKFFRSSNKDVPDELSSLIQFVLATVHCILLEIGLI